MKGMRWWMMLGLCAGLRAAEFSVFLVPGAGADASKGLELREDLHVDVRGSAVPLRLKAARQSIAYPCVAGGRVDLFTVSEPEGEPVRETVASVAVPAEASRGVLVVAREGEVYRVRPMWWGARDLLPGHGVFVNLTNRELGLAMGGVKGRVHPGRRCLLKAKFPSGAEMVAKRVEVFGRRENAPGKVTRLLDQSVAIPRREAAVFVMLPKLEKYVTLLALEPAGTRDPDAARELERHLEAIEKEQP